MWFSLTPVLCRAVPCCVQRNADALSLGSTRAICYEHKASLCCCQATLCYPYVSLLCCALMPVPCLAVLCSQRNAEALSLGVRAICYELNASKEEVSLGVRQQGAMCEVACLLTSCG